MPVIGAGLAYYFSSIQEPSYEAKATLLVQQRSGNLSLGNIDFGQNSQIAATYQRLATARPFFDYVAQNGEIPISASDLSDVLSATIGDSPPWVDLRVEHSNPVIAAEVAQVAADQFIQYVIEQRLSEIAQLQVTAAAQGIVDISALTAAQFAAIDSLTLLEPVEIPEFPVFPRTRQMVIIGFAVGLLIAMGSVLLIEMAQDTVRDPDRVRSRFGLNLLGTIFRFADGEGDTTPIFLKYPNSVHSETFRQLRANFEFAAAPGGGNVFMVTSPGAEEGKSTIISNLAVAIGQSGKRVVIVEGDLRRPSLSRTFGFASGGSGLVNLLVDPSVEISDVTNRTDAQNVDIILAGLNPPNPTELLGSPRMTELIETLKNEYAIVLIDTPPSLLLSDGITIAPLTDGIVIVARSNRTRSSSLLSVVNNMKQTNVRIIGVVINDHQRSRFSYDSYYYNTNYYYSPDDQQSGNEASPSGVLPRIKRGWLKVIRR